MSPRRIGLLALAFLAPVLWLFGDPLFAGRVLYFRDISVTYFPDYSYVARWLAQGLWPLWHSGADAGAPFLAAYPVDLSLLWVFGARATLALSPPLHVLLVMVGTYRLARDLGRSELAAFTAGSILGLSGISLSSVLFPNFFAAAWMPWVVWRVRACAREPSATRVASLAAVVALQLSTFGGEVVAQTALLALVLLPKARGRRAWAALCAAAGLALALAAPALLGLRGILAHTARGSGFSAQDALAFSAPLAVLVEAVLPRFFGDVHTMTSAGYWGQPYFPTQNPYYLSLYLGPGVLLLAARARDRRLLVLAVLGVLLSLGAYGPLGHVMGALMTVLRGPVKFFYLTTVSCALLAAEGLDRTAQDGWRRHRWLAFLPGSILLALAGAAWRLPETVAWGVTGVFPQGQLGHVTGVIAGLWPEALAVGGMLTIGLGAALVGGARTLPFASLLVVMELVRANAGVNSSADRRFYDLRPEPARLVEHIQGAQPARVFSYGVAHSPPLSWNPGVLRRNSDVALYYLDRQSLLPRSHVLDGLEGAYDIDRMGWAPAGSTLSVLEASPLHFEQHRFRLELAAVRWVLSFYPLPEDTTRLIDSVTLPEIAEPLRLYELPDAVPRAFWVPRLEQGSAQARFDPRQVVRVEELPPGPTGYEPGNLMGTADGDWEPSVVYSRPSPHHVGLDIDAPRGFVVVSEGYDPAWRALDSAGPVPLLRANGRYWVLPTAGGRQRIDVRFEPAWLFPSLAICAMGVVLVTVLGFVGRRR